jgi:uncharacterized repeat protein (TIGR01451 family)
MKIAFRWILIVVLLMGIMLLPMNTAADAEWPLFIEYQTMGCNGADVVTSGDYNGDGLTDVAAHTWNNTLCVFLQEPGTGQLGDPLVISLPYLWPPVRGIATGDFNHDGRDDLVLTYTTWPQTILEVWLQNPNGSLGVAQSLTTLSGGYPLTVADLNGDGWDDVAISGVGNVGIHYQLSSGGLGPVTVLASPSSGGDIAAGDVNGDGRTDLVISGNGEPTCVLVHPGTVDGTLGPAVSYPCGPYGGPGSPGLGDVTGDGRTDVVQTKQNNRLSVYAQTPAGSLAPAVTYDAYHNPMPVVVEDVTLDGRDDVIVLHNAWLAASVYRQRPDGTLSTYEIYGVPYASYNPWGLDVADINSDGLPDILTVGANSELVVLYHSTGDLLLSATQSPDVVLPGQLMTLTLRVVNLGPLLTRDVTLSNTLPTGAALVSATPGQGTCLGGAPINCHLGDLGAGDVIEVTIVAQAPPSLGVVVNTASVQTFGDAVVVNNTTQLSIRIGVPRYLPLIRRNSWSH